MLEAGDKQGDIAQPDYLWWDFREVVQDCGLLDLSFFQSSIYLDQEGGWFGGDGRKVKQSYGYCVLTLYISFVFSC